jgi:LPS sulfotransferase NodH
VEKEQAVVNQQIICVVARQRSGTTALRSMLAGTGRMRDFGEIFQNTAQAGSSSFFNFCRENKILLSDTVSAVDVATLCRRYVDHLKEAAGNKHVLIDVKYNSWNVVRPAWHYIHEEPYFMAYLKKMRSIFIFLQRADIVDQVISSYIAESNDKWHNLSLKEADVEKIEVDVKKARKEARLICQSENLLWSFLRRYDKRLHFVYEILYKDGLLTDAAKTAIAKAVGEKLTFRPTSRIRKNDVDKTLAIRNYALVRKAVEEEIASIKRPKWPDFARSAI